MTILWHPQHICHNNRNKRKTLQNILNSLEKFSIFSCANKHQQQQLSCLPQCPTTTTERNGSHKPYAKHEITKRLSKYCLLRHFFWLVVSFTNILRAAFSPISFCWRNSNTNCKFRNTMHNISMQKAARKLLIKMDRPRKNFEDNNCTLALV